MAGQLSFDARRAHLLKGSRFAVLLGCPDVAVTPDIEDFVVRLPLADGER